MARKMAYPVKGKKTSYHKGGKMADAGYPKGEKMDYKKKPMRKSYKRKT